MEDAAKLASDMFWCAYAAAFEHDISRGKELFVKGPQRTADENIELGGMTRDLSGGFCIGGYWLPKRHPRAIEVLFNPFLEQAPVPNALQSGQQHFWAVSNYIERLIYGIDLRIITDICESDNWTGNESDLIHTIGQYVLAPPPDLPLREAIDLVYSSIYTTIKALKFSRFDPVCGGPIEVAVISSDRPFRWVCHKTMSDAIIKQT